MILCIKLIYSEKTTKFGEIFPLLMTECTVGKTKEKISQNFVAFSEYMNFTYYIVSIFGVLKGRFNLDRSLFKLAGNYFDVQFPFSLLEKCLLNRVQRTSFVEVELRHVCTYLRCR